MANIVLDLNGNYTTSKDPSARLDYVFDWSKWLSQVSDTIATATVTVDGATLESYLSLPTNVTAWVSGGTVGTSATVRCQINTTGGRIDERSIILNIKQL